MVRRFAILLCLLPVAGAAETRCGWLDNPTPANWWLTDADGEWLLSVQGVGDRDNGFYDAPWADAPAGQWVERNGSYGYGCACFVGAVDAATGWAVRVEAVRPLPLSRCDADRALPDRDHASFR